MTTILLKLAVLLKPEYMRRSLYHQYIRRAFRKFWDIFGRGTYTRPLFLQSSYSLTISLKSSHAEFCYSRLKETAGIVLSIDPSTCPLSQLIKGSKCSLDVRTIGKLVMPLRFGSNWVKMPHESLKCSRLLMDKPVYEPSICIPVAQKVQWRQGWGTMRGQEERRTSERRTWCRKFAISWMRIVVYL